MPMQHNINKGDDLMATKSILKNVDVKDKKLAKSLVVALENAANKKSQSVSLSRTYTDIKSDKIKEIFGNNS